MVSEKRISIDTAKYYYNIVMRVGRWRASSTLKRKERIAMRKWVEFLYTNALISYNFKTALLDHYKVGSQGKRKTGKPRVSESTIIQYIGVLRQNSYEWLVPYLLGGARLRHIIYMLKNWRPLEEVKHPHGTYESRLYCTRIFCRYFVGEKFGKKRVDYIYIAGKPIHPRTVPKYKPLKDRLHKLGIRVRCFREYINQRLEELAYKHNIRLDAVNFIMSRELSVTGRHYLDTREWADKLYTILLKRLAKMGFLE